MRKQDFMKEIGCVAAENEDLLRSKFPTDFFFGVATSAYQIEGGCKEGNRGPSIWDAFSHNHGNIADGSNGDIAVDHYHRYKEDVDLIVKLGFDAYRFSISWSRIYPDGLGTEINEEGVAFYNNLIDYLLQKGLEPFVTLYHWDLPLHLQESIGGWLNKKIVKYFAIYADTCFERFGDRVKKWITINEPRQTAVTAYNYGIFAPGRGEQPSTDPYLVSHHQILAHAAAVSVYQSKYMKKHGGEVGIVVDCEWAEANSYKTEDKMAAARRIEFQLGWYLDPLFFGGYPEVMRKILGDRLPEFSDEDKELLSCSTDFIGLNHYTSRFVASSTKSDQESYDGVQSLDIIVQYENGELIGEKAASEWLYVCPWGIRRLLSYLTQKYNNPPIYITENGMDDEDRDCAISEMLDDKLRVQYYKGYLAGVARAIKDGSDIRAYFAWSLLDNFEWNQGYTKRFGLVYVDYKNGLSRHPKSSAYWFKRFLKEIDEESREDE